MPQVQQSTFDAIVREAINDFGLSPNDAVVEAKQQLQMTGVTDFSNLSLTPTDNSDQSQVQPRPGETLAVALHQALQCQTVDNSAIAQAARTLEDAARRDRAVAAIAGECGAVDDAAQLCRHALYSSPLFTEACALVAALCGRSEANRARFVGGGQESCGGVEHLKGLVRMVATQGAAAFDEKGQARECHADAASACKAVAAVLWRSERAKVRFSAGEALQHILDIMHIAGVQMSNGATGDDVNPRRGDALRALASACLVVRQLVTPDDASVTVGETFTRARIFGGAKAATESGLQSLSSDEGVLHIIGNIGQRGCEHKLAVGGEERKNVLKECILTGRSLLQCDENCKVAVESGMLDVCITCMQEFCEDDSMVMACMGLIRNLSGRDECKSAIYKEIGTIRAVGEGHLNDAKVAETYFGMLSRLCLRRGDIGGGLVMSGACDEVLRAMHIHGKQSSVMSVGCHLIRNVCSRDDEAKQHLREGKVAERRLRAAWRAYPKECDMAYYALLEMDLLAASEMRRDERYTMPASFFKAP